MASLNQTLPAANFAETLPLVQLEVRSGNARPVIYPLDGVDFLIGTVPGCDLRIPGEAAALNCVIARHPAGVTVRKLGTSHSLLVNGLATNLHELANDDRIQVGNIALRVRIKPIESQPDPLDAEFDKGKHEFHQQVMQFRQQLVQFQQEKAAFALSHGEARERELEAKVRQYELDVLRLNRQQGALDDREIAIQKQAAAIAARQAELDRDSAELEAQLAQYEDWRAKVIAEQERVAKLSTDFESNSRQFAERAAAVEGQQATLTILRSRLERMREEIRARENRLEEREAEHEALARELAIKRDEIAGQQAAIENDQQVYAKERAQWAERSVIMDAAVRQLKEAQSQLAADQDRLTRESRQIEELRRQAEESEATFKGRLAQLAETQERLESERQSVKERNLDLVQREDACAALQEQLRRRGDEIADRHKEVTERLQAIQAGSSDLDQRKAQLDLREQELHQQVETWRRDLEVKTAALQQQHVELAGLDEQQRAEIGQLSAQRQRHAEERAAFQIEQQSAHDKLAQARAELDAMRRDAQAMIDQLPDAELRTGAAVERIVQVREQLRNHLGEVHQYVRQCQDELEQLRGKLQAEVDRLHEREQALTQNQDEHRLAMAAHRQQLIDWQAQITDLKRTLSHDSTRLERKQAQVDERTREIQAESERLAHHAEQLAEQERDVVDRRNEVDRHLVDMREWYRRKLREIAGIPLVAADSGPTILPVSASPTESRAAEDDEQGIVPTGRSILSIGTPVEQGDQRLGKILRDLQLIDADSLTALLSEARRQRRSLRQVLLASGAITLYQLALIEAGNLDGLMLGSVRVIDRLRHSAHETVYRVFDPRRGAEAVLRHLAEADMADAVRPDEFRQRFKQAMLNDPRLANTLEVMDLAGRPAAMQEWLTGLPATDWPPLAAAPGVCYRLLTQAAQGLATAHNAGVVHGHLADSLMFLTGDGVIKICGLGEPPWLVGIQHDDDPTPADDLRALGKMVAGWCTPTGVRKGAKTKPLPDALVSILYRLAAEGDPGYRDVKELLDELQKAAADVPANAEAWDRLLKYVREHGAAEAVLRQSA